MVQAGAFLQLGSARALLNRRVAPSVLAAVLLLLLIVQHVLLWAFLNLRPALLVPAGAAVLALLVTCLRSRPWSDDNAPTVARIALCAAVATIIYVLGGEGRFVYANTDWQVRGAVLRDLASFRWPFVYHLPEVDFLLRVPLGMYLPPAAMGQILGVRAAELALLLHNVLWLTLLFSLGSVLFGSRGSRLLALFVVVGFSGMDVIGQYLAGRSLGSHLEWWGLAQFSAHITQAFWVPQHAMAGWTGALLFLLWRDGRAPLHALVASVPLLALSSPLAALGIVPFAAYAGVESLIRRRLTALDLLVPAIAAIAAIPSLLYLAADSGTVGARSYGISTAGYLVFEALEVGPFLIAMWFGPRLERFGGLTLAVVSATLLLVPFGQIGSFIDFCARASIPALAVLSVQVVDQLTQGRRNGFGWSHVLIALAFAIGLATPLSEVRRAVTLPPSPAPLCNYFGVVANAAATYVAPMNRVPRIIAPAEPHRVAPSVPGGCWDGPWPDP